MPFNIELAEYSHKPKGKYGKNLYNCPKCSTRSVFSRRRRGLYVWLMKPLFPGAKTELHCFNCGFSRGTSDKELRSLAESQEQDDNIYIDEALASRLR